MMTVAMQYSEHHKLYQLTLAHEPFLLLGYIMVVFGFAQLKSHGRIISDVHGAYSVSPEMNYTLTFTLVS